MGKRKITATDLFQLVLVGSVAVHPDGQRMVVSLTHMRDQDNSYETHLWLLRKSTQQSAQLTFSTKSEKCPSWSADGKWLAFISNRLEDKDQVYVMSADGGEAVPVTRLKEGVEAFAWSPKGLRLVAVSRGPISDDAGIPGPLKPENGGLSDALTGTAARLKYTSDVRKVHRLRYKQDGLGLLDDLRSHLYLVDLADYLNRGVQHGSRSGAGTLSSIHFPRVQRLTEGNFDVVEFDWAPDGQTLVFSSNLREDADWTGHRFLYQIPVPAPATENLTAVTAPLVPLAEWPCVQEHPRYSRDGHFIAFYGHNREQGGATLNGLWLFNMESGETHRLGSAELTFGDDVLSDARPQVNSGGLQWSEHSRHLYTLVSTRGTVQLVRVNVATGELMWLTEGRHGVYAYDLDGHGEGAALVISDPVHPGDVYWLDLPVAGEPVSDLRRLTQCNADWLAEVQLTLPERFTFDSGGVTVEGWTLLPQTPVPALGYPTVVQVHGGPLAMYGETFFFEFQYLAAQGIAVVYTNPRGSTGYGQDFSAAIRGAWGGLDFADVEAGLTAAMLQVPLNAARVAIAGGSYGGFMAAWAAGHSSRYCAAVVMRGCVNEFSMFGVSDIGYTDLWDFPGTPWKQVDAYRRVSPLAAVDQIHIPVLILHSEHDLRCPIEEAEQLYTALRLRRVPVEFIRFPEENHSLSRNGKPWHRVYRLEKINEFLSRELTTHA
ncbi:S9 family peptidase [Alicyclobacillaceae bacterium I2511]|nr:S9 family peptidase [Alicyclobacillaceae bacterium I2511]